MNRPRILIVGCGDVGLRLLALLRRRYRVFAASHSPHRIDEIRGAGAIPIEADLDHRDALFRLAGLASTVVHLVPPQAHGRIDARTRHLVAALGSTERFVYISTTGVYGDCEGAWVSETRRTNPLTARAERRVDAERVLRKWARACRTRLTILRVPGIYAANRLPIARLAALTPTLDANDDVFTNHIHADDLARSIVAAISRGASQRVINAVDDSAITMSDWFDLVADAHAMPRPPRMPRAELAAQVSPALLSFMSESRRLTNTRLKQELHVSLRYPTVRAALGCNRESGSAT